MKKMDPGTSLDLVAFDCQITVDCTKGPVIRGDSAG